MLSVDVQQITLMSLGDNTIFIIDVDLSEIKERMQKYTDYYLLVKLSVPIIVNEKPQVIMIEEQFANKVKDINLSDYIVRGLEIQWPGSVDKERLRAVLKGNAILRFFDTLDVNEEIE